MTAILRAEAQHEFEAASRSSLVNELSAILTGREWTLLPLRDVVQASRPDGQVDRGEQEITIAQIRGSENRTEDFDASFHPLKAHTRERWVRLYTLMQSGKEMPPISVYQLGDVYFVKDGHHRISVARRLGWETIRAHVVEVKTRAPVGSDMDSHDLLRVAEYASFLERTQLDKVRPDARLLCSHLGRYDVIFDHILGHRYFLSLESGREVPLPEAASSWYDYVYRPLMAVAERHRLAEHLPDWTEADIYLALTRLWLDLGQQGQPTGPERAAEVLLTDAWPRPPHGPRTGRRRHGLRAPGAGGRRGRDGADRGRRTRRARRLLRRIRGGRSGEQ